MPKYILAYHGGGKPETEAEGRKVMQQWQDWLADLGPKCLDEGNPVGLSKTVSAEGIADNGGANPLSGYSIVEAADVAEACEMAKACPILDGGKGSVEVAPIIEM
ncbi:hypothetical protein XM53_04265 [Roseovarius atlanticus]|uniref:YCII-related domain-containing protein n=1 Tax=Roseovarius atlanticus TaxID=1641875 RepID=A0A0T5NY81_9RHOB|nr:YciI family protein [Roseovarius atlanticus]KRS13790.1 hypothetical protein XM53_04265 [Roseovarius atlanticus]